MAALTEAVFALDARVGLVNLGTGGAALNPTSGSNPSAADSNDPTYLAHTGENYLYLPGGTNQASSPSSTALNVTGDIDIIVRVMWTTTNQQLVGKWGGASSRSYSFYIGGDNLLWLQTTPNGSFASSVYSQSTVTLAAAGVVAGVPAWLRVTKDVDNGASGNTTKFYWAPDSRTVPTVWTQIGGDRVVAGTTSIFAGTDPLWIGRNQAGTVNPLVGNVYRVIIKNGIDGGVVFDADFTTGITPVAQTSFTESSSNAATVTINRSASGRKSVAVARPTWLFGTDDYLEIPDSPSLSFGASDSFTLLVAGRWRNTQGTNDTLIAKKANTTNTTTGWSLSNGSTTALNGQAQIGDGTAGVTATSASRTAGALTTIAAVRNVTTDTVTVYTDGVAGTPVTDSTTGTLANSEVVRIGRLSGAGTEYADMELFAVAIWRRALSGDEVAAVSTALLNAVVTPTSPDDTALMLHTQPGDVTVSQPNTVALHTLRKGLVLE